MAQNLIRRTASVAMAALVLAAILIGFSEAEAQGKGAAGQGKGRKQADDMHHRMEQHHGASESRMREQRKVAIEERKLGRERLRDRDIYGGELMTAEERNRYRQQLANARTDREWAQLRAEHQKEMRIRAEQRGVELRPAVPGEHMLTARERQRYVERMQNASSDAEREQIRTEHREMVRQRAREIGVGEPPGDE